MILENDEPLFSRACVAERGARYVAQSFKQDILLNPFQTMRRHSFDATLRCRPSPPVKCYRSGRITECGTAHDD
jgi:hypothetical protein